MNNTWRAGDIAIFSRGSGYEIVYIQFSQPLTLNSGKTVITCDDETRTYVIFAEPNTLFSLDEFTPNIIELHQKCYDAEVSMCGIMSAIQEQSYDVPLYTKCITEFNEIFEQLKKTIRNFEEAKSQYEHALRIEKKVKDFLKTKEE